LALAGDARSPSPISGSVPVLLFVLVLERKPEPGAIRDLTILADLQILLSHLGHSTSRSVLRAVFTAVAAASSHDCGLVPMTSMTR